MGLHLYFLSDPTKVHDFNGAIADEAKIVAQHIPITSIHQIVSVATAQCSLYQQKIKHLIISGHGSRYYARIGHDEVGVDTVEKYAWILSQLRPFLEPAAVVTLWGCDVGKNKELLQKLSRILGVRVQGAISPITVGVWGPFGYMSSEDTNVCFRTWCYTRPNFNPRAPDGMPDFLGP